MIDDKAREHRKAFEEEYGVSGHRRPEKYCEMFIYTNQELKYDHFMFYRNKEYDYVVVSPYHGAYHDELLSEGFKEIPHMYNESCQSYVKRYKNTRRKVLEEV